MINPFNDQATFMQACDQTIDINNPNQFDMYVKLIGEEYCELLDAVKNKNSVETLDALIDIIVVTIGTIHSMGADAEEAWKTVMISNLAKIDKETGKVRKREDGKVLKPEGWQPPNLKKFLKK